MKKETLLAEIRQAKADGVKQIWYGHVEQSDPVDIGDAIADIELMDEDAIGDGDWGAWEYEARIIGETSAGLTAIEIYRAGTLIYSHDYFANGATDAEYRSGLLASYDDAVACDGCESWDGCDAGTPYYDRTDTTHVIATYRPRTGWTVEIPDYYGSDGQSYDWIKANRDRLPADAVAAWDKYYG